MPHAATLTFSGGVSAASISAFHPRRSCCADVTPRTSCRCSEPLCRSSGTKESATSVTSRRVPESSGGSPRRVPLRASSEPLRRAAPLSGTTTNDATARSGRWCCSSAAAGTVTSTVSGAAMSYAASGGTTSVRWLALCRRGTSRPLPAIVQPLMPGATLPADGPLSASVSATYAAEPGVPASTGQSQPSSSIITSCCRERSAASVTRPSTSSPDARARGVLTAIVKLAKLGSAVRLTAVAQYGTETSTSSSSQAMSYSANQPSCSDSVYGVARWTLTRERATACQPSRCVDGVLSVWSSQRWVVAASSPSPGAHSLPSRVTLTTVVARVRTASSGSTRGLKRMRGGGRSGCCWAISGTSASPERTTSLSRWCDRRIGPSGTLIFPAWPRRPWRPNSARFRVGGAQASKHSHGGVNISARKSTYAYNTKGWCFTPPPLDSRTSRFVSHRQNCNVEGSRDE